MSDKKMSFTVLNNQPTEDKPYLVNDYPYGFRLRCKIRYYVETTKRGQRFVSQTLNPKTNQWNKPKKSTYLQILLIGLNEKNHVTYDGISMYSLEEAIKFNEKYAKFLNKYQTIELNNIIKMSEIYSKVKYTITEGERTPEEDEKQKQLNRAINILAVKNAEKSSSHEEAVQTFKRSK